jgi:hypothetical protein
MASWGGNRGGQGKDKHLIRLEVGRYIPSACRTDGEVKRTFSTLRSKDDKQTTAADRQKQEGGRGRRRGRSVIVRERRTVAL